MRLFLLSLRTNMFAASTPPVVAMATSTPGQKGSSRKPDHISLHIVSSRRDEKCFPSASVSRGRKRLHSKSDRGFIHPPGSVVSHPRCEKEKVTTTQSWGRPFSRHPPAPTHTHCKWPSCSASDGTSTSSPFAPIRIGITRRIFLSAPSCVSVTDQEEPIVTQQKQHQKN